MRTPESLHPLLEHGVIEDVIRPLMSGKEAQVYLVRSEGEERVAKVYKEAQDRTFKHRATYTEGRRTRNSRDQRAMRKRTVHGRAQDEQMWRSTEVEMIYRLRDAGVRVPIPHHFIHGVLVMELVKGPDAGPAPRLGEVVLSRSEAESVYEFLLREVVKMLCAGVVHGDLSDFNVLLGTDGPVLIDLPQAIDASANQNARSILVRDVNNLNAFVARYAPRRPSLCYAEEMWQLYEQGCLAPDTELTGRYRPSQKRTNVAAMLKELEELEEIVLGDDRPKEKAPHEARKRRPPRPPARPPAPPAPKPPTETERRAAPGRPSAPTGDKKRDSARPSRRRSKKRRSVRAKPPSDAQAKQPTDGRGKQSNNPRAKQSNNPRAKQSNNPRTKQSNNPRANPATAPSEATAPTGQRRRRRRRRRPGATKPAD